MAWLYILSAECGENETSAETFAEYFKDISFILSTGKIATFSNRIYQDSEMNWWAFVYADNVSKSGAYDLDSAVELSEVGFRLYRHLLSAPSYRYAVAGVETEEFMWYSELKKAVFINADGEHELKGYFNGVVIKNEIWEEMEKPKGFFNFSNEHHWIPYQGETYSPVFEENFSENEQKLKMKLNEIKQEVLPSLFICETKIN